MSKPSRKWVRRQVRRWRKEFAQHPPSERADRTVRTWADVERDEGKRR